MDLINIRKKILKQTNIKNLSSLKNYYENKIAILYNNYDNYDDILIHNNENTIIINNKNMNKCCDFYFSNEKDNIMINENIQIQDKEIEILTKIKNKLVDNSGSNSSISNSNSSINDSDFYMDTYNIILFCIHIGIKTIIINGLNPEDNFNNISIMLHNNYGIQIFTLSDNLLNIDKITINEYIKIVNYKHLFIIRYPNQFYSNQYLITFGFLMFENIKQKEKLLKNGFKVITFNNIIHHYNFNINNLLIEYFKNDENNNLSIDDENYIINSYKIYEEILYTIFDKNCYNNSILYGYHPFGFNVIIENYKKNIPNILKYKNIKIFGWHDEPHYFANGALNMSVENIATNILPYECYALNELNYLITPSYIYFNNLNMEIYKNKIIDIFYCLDETLYDSININNYHNRKNNILTFNNVINDNFKTLIVKTDTVNNIYNLLLQHKAIIIFNQQKPLNWLTIKHIEVLFCGCLGFFEKNELLEKQLGLIEFKHYVPCSHQNGNIVTDVEYYKKYLDTDEGYKIANTGYTYIRNKFASLQMVDRYIQYFNC